MVFLVTGGTGLVGSFFLELLDKLEIIDNKDCRIIVRSPEKRAFIEKMGFSPILADLNDQKSIDIALEDVDVVLNFTRELI